MIYRCGSCGGIMYPSMWGSWYTCIDCRYSEVDPDPIEDDEGEEADES